MEDFNLELLGMFAGTCTTSCLIPQVYHIWRTRSVQDISLVMYIIFIIGLSSWLLYGIYVNAISMMIANSLSLILAFSILFMKIKWSRQCYDFVQHNKHQFNS